MGKRELVEYRKHKRFYYKNGGPFAVTGPDSMHLGQVVNISLGGFSFRYLESGQKWLNDAVDFEVFFGKEALPLHDLQLETVFDTNENCPSIFTSKDLRQRGVRFVNPTSEQKYLLQSYIRENICAQCRDLESKAASELECALACMYDPSFTRTGRKNLKVLRESAQAV